MSRHRRRAEKDGGQAVIWLVVLGMLGMGLLAMKLALPLAEGGDRLGRGQTAAEAAALAGAQAGSVHLLSDLDGVDDLGGRLRDGCSEYGRAEASTLAADNEGEVTSYCYNAKRGRVRVQVRSVAATSTGRRVAADAEASWDVDWSRCAFDPVPDSALQASESTSTGTSAVLLHCRSTELRFVKDSGTGRLWLDPADQLAEQVKTRLVR